MSSSAAPSGPIAVRIREKLADAFAPQYLDVINESYMHNVPKGAETHFKVVVVTEQFEGKPLIQRHRMVNELLQEELSSGVHALSIQSKTPEQWAKSSNVQPSPNCQGGMVKDPTKKEFLESLKNK
uniref:BolA-like protein n=1 Tax=Globisporangium ultimum (strain ATCC 200006 / CBS 805.95 / DAOM BR144) TaxID=431595 RepID=K3X665_GLOUD